MDRKTQRVWLIDEVRGMAILLMVIYHLFFDLVVLYNVDIPIFFSPVLSVIRDFFAGLFIFISGAACRFSSNNLKRGVICFSLGMVVTYVTAVVMPNTPDLFGILHLLGVCMILFSFLEKVFDKLPSWTAVILCVLLFCLTWNIPHGFFGIPGIFQIPNLSLFKESGLFFPFGVTGTGFESSA